MIGFSLMALTTGRRGATPAPVSIGSEKRSAATSQMVEPCSGPGAGSRNRKIRFENSAISNQGDANLSALRFTLARALEQSKALR